jgi:hypothetical protein
VRAGAITDIIESPTSPPPVRVDRQLGVVARKVLILLPATAGSPARKGGRQIWWPGGGTTPSTISYGECPQWELWRRLVSPLQPIP